MLILLARAAKRLEYFRGSCKSFSFFGKLVPSLNRWARLEVSLNQTKFPKFLEPAIGDGFVNKRNRALGVSASERTSTQIVEKGNRPPTLEDSPDGWLI